ncbi:MAG: tetratricopeptide repeat protein, partial [Cyclobacteriaceae bacterium]|nr:tetratricopeptide repeat protein [Cyclobacteriaceae bacterium]
MKRFSFNITRALSEGLNGFLTIAGVCLAVAVFGQETMYKETAADLYRRGLTLLDGKNLAQARDVFEQYTSYYSDENQGNARYYTAYCALSLYHRDGEKLMEDFISDFPAHPKTGIAYYEMGVFYFKGNNYSKTVQFLEKANIASLTTEKRDEAWFMLGYASFSLKKFEEALENFNKIKNKSGGSSSAAAYYAGFIEYDMGDYDNALTDFQRAEKSEAYSSEVPYMIASVLYKQKEYDRLLNYSTGLLNSDANLSNKPTLYLLAAEALFSKKDYKKAAEYYEQYNESVRNNMSPELIYRLGYSYYKTGEKEKAINFLRRVAADKSEMSVYASYYLGILYLDEGNKRYAVTAFDVVRKNTFNIGLQEDGAYQYAKLQYDLGDSRQAILAMEDFIVKYTQSTRKREMTELLSEAYLTSNAYEKAIAYIEKLPNRSKNIELAY